jgi:hypothetical protein
MSLISSAWSCLVVLISSTKDSADIDAVFRAIGQELQDLESHRETEAEAVSEQPLDPDRTAVDEFWANDKAGYW